MDAIDVSDSTDWNNTSLPSFAAVDASLRCQICKDFYNAAVITTCSHTFCSICIRRCINADSRCAACKTTIQESQLKRNAAVQDVVDAFAIARPSALTLARERDHTVDPEILSRRGSKRKRIEDEEEGYTPESSQAQAPRRSQRSRGNKQSAPIPEVQIMDGDEDDDNYTPEDGLVACPICRRRMKEENVFSHLNVCDSTAVSSSPKRPSRTPTPLVQAPPPKPAKPQERLPSLNYSLLKETALRKKLQDLNIPSFGNKSLLQRRHIEWINLWNANCDSSRPRSRKELLADLDRWEKTQGGRSKDAGAGTEVNEVMKKDFDGAGWAKSHKSDFNELIANARRKRDVPKAENATENGHDDRTTSPFRADEQAPAPISDATSDAADRIPSKQNPPPAPHPPEHVDRPISPVPGFNLDQAVPAGTPELGEAGSLNEARSASLPFSHSNGDSAVNEQIWRGESKMRKMPMFEMPGDPVVDTEMNGLK